MSFNQALTLYPEREGLIDGDRRFTYRQFGVRVARLSQALSARGIAKGSVVAIIAPNCHQYMEAYYACAVLGAVLNPINFRLSAREISAILQDSGASVVICHNDFADLVVQSICDYECPSIKYLLWINSDPASIGVKDDPLSIEYEEDYENALAQGNDTLPEFPKLEAHDLAHLYYTSGTTGKPKGVMLTHGNVAIHAQTTINELKITTNDTWAHIAAMFHLADAWATFAITWVGGKHVFLPYFRPSEVLKTIERDKVTISNLIPTMLNAMVHEEDVDKYNYSSLRVILSGGAPIAPETVKRIINTFGCDYVQTYGMTETSPYLTLSILTEQLRSLSPEQQLALKSRTGRPFAAVELKVVRPDGSEVAGNDKEVGEIIVKGPTITPGYWHQPDITASTIRDGWLYTADLAVVDEYGYVNIVDRKKDMIITGGENVYSTEVEHVLYEHPAVLECAVIGLPDKQWGEAVKAIVVLKHGQSLSEHQLIEFTRENLAHYKCPKSVDFVTALPKTGSGKITKAALKQKYLQSLS